MSNLQEKIHMAIKFTEIKFIFIPYSFFKTQESSFLEEMERRGGENT